MSGFQDAFIEKAKEVRKETAVILMDGEEIEEIMNANLNFDEVLTIKRAAFDQRSDPYYRVGRGGRHG